MKRIWEQKKIDLGSGSVGRLMLRLALPAVVAQVINMLYNMVDRMYVGTIPEIGTDALAGLCTALTFALTFRRILKKRAALLERGENSLASEEAK